MGDVLGEYLRTRNWGQTETGVEKQGSEWNGTYLRLVIPAKAWVTSLK